MNVHILLSDIKKKHFIDLILVIINVNSLFIINHYEILQ